MTNEDDITQLLHTYERSLNASDATLAASCYAADGVFMPTGQPTVTAGGIRQAYEGIFGVIHLDVTFSIDELVVARLHALARERPGVFDLLLADAPPARLLGRIVDVGGVTMQHAARPKRFLEFRVLRIVGIFRILFGVEVIQVSEKLVEAVCGR